MLGGAEGRRLRAWLRSSSSSSRITTTTTITQDDRRITIIEQSPEARVHSAADEIEREGGKPTVVSVRERAGVSNADATRFLRSWREDKLASGSTIAALPPSIAEHSQRVAGLIWAEASQLASASHAAVEREWHEQKALQEREIAELVESLDATERAAATAAEVHAAEKTALQAEIESARAERAQAAEELEEKSRVIAELEKQIIEERAAAEANRNTIEALVSRIPSADETE